MATFPFSRTRPSLDASTLNLTTKDLRSGLLPARFFAAGSSTGSSAFLLGEEPADDSVAPSDGAFVEALEGAVEGVVEGAVDGTAEGALVEAAAEACDGALD